MSYVYSELKTGQIRVLILHPGTFNDDIHISLCTYMMEGSGTKEPYEAVSYVWGSTDFAKSIQCNGHELRVTESVETLLGHLRLLDVSRRLWIDGICINQSDLSERSKQVLMMKRIFSAPSRVLIWVGSEDEDTGRAIEQFLAWGGKPLRKDRHLYYIRSPIDAIQRFTNRPWFHRVWTFQEACLPADAEVICGRFRLPWMCVLEAASRLMSKSMLQNAFGRAADSMAALILFSPLAERSERQKPELLDLLRLGRNREATDDRDKVFGILGLLHEDDKVVITPDYSMDITDLYIHCAQTILMNSHHLQLLTSCLGPIQRSNLPSWVPDWSVRRRAAVLQGFDWGQDKTEIYHLNRALACGSSPGSVVFGRTLYQRGAYLGTVTSTRSLAAFLEALGGSQDNYVSRLHRRKNRFLPKFRKLLHSLSVPELYRQTGESSQMALLRTLCAGRLPEANVMQEFVLRAGESTKRQILILLDNIYKHMVKQHSDPAQLSSVKSMVKQMKMSDQSVDYGSIVAFSYEYVERTPEFGTSKFCRVRPGKKEDHIPAEWAAKLLAIYARQKGSVGKAAESSSEDSSLQDMQDFLAVCDMGWTIFDYPLDKIGGASAWAVMAYFDPFLNEESHMIIDKVGSSMLTFSSSRVLFRTDNGLIGLGPDYMSDGDEVWDLIGSNVPFLLRQETSDSRNGDGRHYRLVGECYVHGLMSGELWEEETKQSATHSLKGKDLKFETIQIV